ACGLSICTLALLAARKAEGQQRWGGADNTFSAWEIMQNIPGSVWKTMLPTALVIGSLLIVFAGGAIYLSATGRRRLAATMIAAAMVPTGLGMIDGVARMAQFFSLASAARYL